MKVSFEKVLNFVDVYFISLGLMIGAGIYSLLNIVTKYSGKYAWFSFLIGGFISLMTAFSYYDLSKIYNSNASEYEYFTDILSDKFKYGYIFLLVMFSLLTASVLLIVFSNILIFAIGKELLSNNSSIQFIIQLIVISAAVLLNIIDIKLVSDLNFYITCLETGFLLLLIVCAFYWNVFIFSKKKKKVNSIQLENNNNSLSLQGIMYGAFLSILAFTGFEAIPKLTEETLDSENTIPNAIKYSVITVVIIYSLVSISVNSVLGISKVVKYQNPISNFFEYLFGKQFLYILNLVSLISIFDTILLNNTFVSRTIQSISAKGDLIDALKEIDDKYKTPINAIIFSGIVVLLLSSTTNVELNLYVTNILTFIIFILVNICCILAPKDKQKDKQKDKNNKEIRKNESKNSIGFFYKDYSYIGLMSSILMLCHSFKN
tara:strand:+ start:860 stop:2155 length:1296 start_codon:yes stop_codon:yes gene_type:complete